MTEPDAQSVDKPVDDGTPDAFEEHSETDPDPQMNDDADDTFEDLDPGVDDGNTDLDGEPDRD